MLIDTHCHIHEADYPLPVADVLQRAAGANVGKMILVGTSEQSSKDAIKLAVQHDNLFATIGVHPHDTKDGYGKIAELASDAVYLHASGHLQPESDQTPGLLSDPERSRSEHERYQQRAVVAVGEIGLDYYYNHSPRDVQITALESQIQTALDNNLPIIFHVREAFQDFWPIFDNFHGIRGVLHSFTDSQANLDEGFTRGLYVGVNGISTFTKDSAQQEMYASIPLDKMLFETDAPFLTPAPYRGTINEPAFVSEVAKFHADTRGVSLADIAAATTANANALFQFASSHHKA